MANFDINNFVIDHVIRGVMVSTSDGTLMYSINQIEEPSLSCTADERTAVDALGTPIMTFQNGKQAEFSATNSLFDLNLLATQMGTTKEVASAGAKIVTPVFFTGTVKSSAFTLTKEPIADITEIQILKGDGNTGQKYTVTPSDPQENQFSYDSESKKFTFNASVPDGTQFFVLYETESESAVQVSNSAVNYPKAGKFIMEVLGCDVCDPSTLVYAYVIFPNAKLDSNVDITLTTDGKHPFSMKAQQAYCDNQKVLFNIVIPETE